MKVAVDLKQVVTFSQTMFSWHMRRWVYDDVDAKLYYFLINSFIQRLTLDSDFYIKLCLLYKCQLIFVYMSICSSVLIYQKHCLSGNLSYTHIYTHEILVGIYTINIIYYKVRVKCKYLYKTNVFISSL
jgi:hypothetical protein